MTPDFRTDAQVDAQQRLVADLNHDAALAWIYPSKPGDPMEAADSNGVTYVIEFDGNTYCPRNPVAR